MSASEQRRILVVEDEPVTRDLLVGCLERAGYDVSRAEDGQAMRAALAGASFDLVLLDVELPAEDGFTLASFVRARSDAAIVFVTRRSDVIDRVVGLEIGGDDYIVKPPDLRELVARVRAVLRRRDESSRREASATTTPAGPATRLSGGWRLDRARHCLFTPRGEEVPLTPGEMAVLSVLLDAGGRTVRRDALANALRAVGGDAQPRSLDVLVHRVRRKLGEGGAVVPRMLLTVHGVGYRLGTDADGTD